MTSDGKYWPSIHCQSPTGGGLLVASGTWAVCLCSLFGGKHEVSGSICWRPSTAEQHCHPQCRNYCAVAFSPHWVHQVKLPLSPWVRILMHWRPFGEWCFCNHNWHSDPQASGTERQKRHLWNRELCTCTDIHQPCYNSTGSVYV